MLPAPVLQPAVGKGEDVSYVRCANGSGRSEHRACQGAAMTTELAVLLIVAVGGVVYVLAMWADSRR